MLSEHVWSSALKAKTEIRLECTKIICSLSSHIRLEIAEYQANIIAKNLFSQCNTEGRQYMVMQEICDHRKDRRAIPI